MNRYYQLGGFNPSLNWCAGAQKYGSEPTLAADIFGALAFGSGSDLELVLGIKENGSSHLLLTEEQVRMACQKCAKRYPSIHLLGSEFISISPILFESKEQLAAKLRTLAPKYRKGQPMRDNSQANQNFTSSGTNSDGSPRGMFEDSRLYWAIVNEEVDKEKFNVKDDSWKLTTRVIAFTLNGWLNDTRPLADRKRAPRVLDIGLAEADTSLEIKEGTTLHIVPKENSLQLQPGLKKADFTHGETEMLGAENEKKVQDAFEGPDARSSPIILLVHDEEQALTVLRNIFHVDTTFWKSGISDLLANTKRRQYQKYREPQRGPYMQHRRRDSRSQSPPRHRSDGRRTPSRDQPSNRAPIFVVDVKKLHTALFMTQDYSRSLSSIAAHMRMPDIKTDEWCAGNEAHLIIEIFKSMVSGKSIDDQRTERNNLPMQPAPSTSQPVAGGGADPYDDDASDYGDEGD